MLDLAATTALWTWFIDKLAAAAALRATLILLLASALCHRPMMNDDMGQLLPFIRDGRLKFGLTAFATLLVVVDPFGVLPIFISLAKNRSPRERTDIATRAVLLGFMISLFFLVAGNGSSADKRSAALR